MNNKHQPIFCILLSNKWNEKGFLIVNSNFIYIELLKGEHFLLTCKNWTGEMVSSIWCWHWALLTPLNTVAAGMLMTTLFKVGCGTISWKYPIFIFIFCRKALFSSLARGVAFICTVSLILLIAEWLLIKECEHSVLNSHRSIASSSPPSLSLSLWLTPAGFGGVSDLLVL